MIVYNPNRNIFEDRVYNNDYSIEDIKVALTRSRLSIQLLDRVIKSDTFIFQFWYPKFSYCCWLAIQFIIYFSHMDYLLTYISVGLIWILLA